MRELGQTPFGMLDELTSKFMHIYKFLVQVLLCIHIRTVIAEEEQ